MKIFATVCLICFLLMGCNSPSTYVAVYDFPNDRWTADQNVVFDFQALSNRTPGDIRIALRYLPEVCGKRFSLLIRTTDSRNVSFIDTLDVTLSRGSGDAIRSQEIVVRKNVMWPRQAAHYITITPDRALDDMVSLSLQIANATPIE